MHKRTIHITTATPALRITKVTNRTRVTLSARITLTTLALPVQRLTQLADRTDTIAGTIATTETRLPTPSTGHTLRTTQPTTVRRTDATTIQWITNLSFARTLRTTLTTISGEAVKTVRTLIAMLTAYTDLTITLARPRVALMAAWTSRIATTVMTADALREVPMTWFAFVAAPAGNVGQTGTLTGTLVTWGGDGADLAALTLCKDTNRKESIKVLRAYKKWVLMNDSTWIGDEWTVWKWDK